MSVEVTEKGDLRAVMDDFSADVQDEGDQWHVGGVPALDLAGPAGSAEPSRVETADAGDPLPGTPSSCDMASTAVPA